jgi:hypothetical protein
VPHAQRTAPDPRPPRGTRDFANLVAARLDVVCTCAARLEVHSDRHGRLVALVRHGAGCELGALVDAQPTVVVTTEGGGRQLALTHPAPTQDRPSLGVPLRKNPPSESRTTMSENGQGRREQLETLQVSLLAAVDTASARELPGLSRELRQVMAELARIGAPEEVSKADQLLARRKERRAAPRRNGKSQ